MNRFLIILVCVLCAGLYGAQQTINLGTTANDGTGDSLRAAMGKVNTNFNEMFALTNRATFFPTVSAMVSGGTNNSIAIAGGYWTNGDGGGGTFTLTNTWASTNTGTRIASATTSNSWNRIYSGQLNVKWFGAKGDGTTDDSVAFYNTSLVATNGRYFIPAGTFLVQQGTNVFSHAFTADSGAVIKVGSTTYDVSGALASGWRVSSVTTQYMTIKHAISGATIGRLSDGLSSSDSHIFYLPFDWRRDSHAIIMAPASTNGVSDLLVRRSEANADAYGNRFTPIYFEEDTDRLGLLYATTASGAPSFDAAQHVYAGTSPRLVFPALRAELQQGFAVQTRAGGAFRLDMIPGSATHTLQSVSNSVTLGGFTRSYTQLGGKSFNTLSDVPGLYEPANTWSKLFSDLTSTNLPTTNTFFTLTGATKYAVIGTMRVAATASGSGGYWRESRFTYDGSTFTLTDLVNTLPAQITALVTTNQATNMQFQAAYAGGLGGGAALSVTLDWNHVGR